MSYNRGHLKAFSDLLLSQASVFADCVQRMEQCVQAFDIHQEVLVMRDLSRAQERALPPVNREINAEFVQNGAVYQQNRQRQLRGCMLTLSNVYMEQAAALFETAANLRRQAQAVDDTAPVVDFARRFAHLELSADIWQLLGLTR